MQAARFAEMIGKRRMQNNRNLRSTEPPQVADPGAGGAAPSAAPPAPESAVWRGSALRRFQAPEGAFRPAGRAGTL
eukprot:13358116-Alexandrium_andersonii.AAC.1